MSRIVNGTTVEVNPSIFTHTVAGETYSYVKVLPLLYCPTFTRGHRTSSPFTTEESSPLTRYRVTRVWTPSQEGPETHCPRFRGPTHPVHFLRRGNLRRETILRPLTSLSPFV